MKSLWGWVFEFNGKKVFGITLGSYGAAKKEVVAKCRKLRGGLIYKEFMI